MDLCVYCGNTGYILVNNCGYLHPPHRVSDLVIPPALAVTPVGRGGQVLSTGGKTLVTLTGTYYV